MHDHSWDWLRTEYFLNPMVRHTLEDLPWSLKNLNQDAGSGNIKFTYTETGSGGYGIYKYDYIWTDQYVYDGTNSYHFDLKLLYNASDNTWTFEIFDYGLDWTYSQWLTKLRNHKCSDGRTYNLLDTFEFWHNEDVGTVLKNQYQGHSRVGHNSIPNEVLSDILDASESHNWEWSIRLLRLKGSKLRTVKTNAIHGDRRSKGAPDWYSNKNTASAVGYSITCGDLSYTTEARDRHGVITGRETDLNSSNLYHQEDTVNQLVYADTHHFEGHSFSYKTASGNPPTFSFSPYYNCNARGYPGLVKPSFDSWHTTYSGTQYDPHPTNTFVRFDRRSHKTGPSMSIATTIRGFDWDFMIDPYYVRSTNYAQQNNPRLNYTTWYGDAFIPLNQLGPYTIDDPTICDYDPCGTMTSAIYGRAEHYFFNHRKEGRFYYTYALVASEVGHKDHIQVVIPGPVRFISQEMLPTVAAGNAVDWDAVCNDVCNHIVQLSLPVGGANNYSMTFSPIGFYDNDVITTNHIFSPTNTSIHLDKGLDEVGDWAWQWQLAPCMGRVYSITNGSIKQVQSSVGWYNDWVTAYYLDTYGTVTSAFILFQNANTGH